MIETFRILDIARMCGVPESIVERWMEEENLPSHSTVGGQRRVIRSHLEAMLRRLDIPLPPELLSRSGPQVLIVDDDPMDRALISSLVLRLRPDAEVFEAGNGFEAGHMAGSHPPDLILLDLRLAGASGADVCEILRQNFRFKHTRILAMSGFDDPQAQKDILDKGADGFVCKSIDHEELARRIAEFLPSKSLVV